MTVLIRNGSSVYFLMAAGKICAGTSVTDMTLTCNYQSKLKEHPLRLRKSNGAGSRPLPGGAPRRRRRNGSRPWRCSPDGTPGTARGRKALRSSPKTSSGQSRKSSTRSCCSWWAPPQRRSPRPLRSAEPTKRLPHDLRKNENGCFMYVTIKEKKDEPSLEFNGPLSAILAA